MQTTKSLPANGRYVVSAGEDSHVYAWKHEMDTQTYRTKGLTVSRSYEHFHSQDVLIAIPWPGFDGSLGPQDLYAAEESAPNADEASTAYHRHAPVQEANDSRDCLGSTSCCSDSLLSETISSPTSNYIFDRIASSWTDEKLVPVVRNRSNPRLGLDFTIGMTESMLAWGLVIFTAGLRGEIRIFLNFGLPIRIRGLIKM